MLNQWISELKFGDEVDTQVAVVHSRVQTRKNGAPYLTLVICDRTGKIPAKWWEPTSTALEQACSLRYVRIRGKVTEYQQTLEIALQSAPVDIGVPDNPDDYLVASPIALGDLEERLVRHIESVHDPRLNALLRAIFCEDSKLADSFKRFPAALKNHHSFRYGLLQHSIEVADVVATVADKQQYWGGQPIWRDLALTGALLHDIGKVEEIEQDHATYLFTTSGSLLGHITQGVIRVGRKVDRLRKDGITFPKRLEELLLHLVSSHHGKGEWGSPKAPMMAEAVLIHMADKISTDLYYIEEARAEAVTGVEIVWQQKLDSGFGNAGRFVYVGDLSNLKVLEQDVYPSIEGFPIPAELRLPVLRLISSEDAQDAPFPTRRLAVYGKVAAGQPLDAAYADGEMMVDATVLGSGNSPCYLLSVQGDSMIGDGIQDGDLIVVRYQEAAEFGDLVVARLPEEGATVKRLIRSAGQVFLKPSNPTHHPIPVSDPSQLIIQGRVIGIARRMEG